MRTTLYSNHIERGARMGPFGGWEMPIQYTGILAEHRHTRGSASVFDTCHMAEFSVRGRDAQANLERLVTCPLASLKAGRCRYGFLLEDKGGVLDDLIVYRLDANEFMIVANAGTREADAEWISDHLEGTVLFEDVSNATGKLDLQGPLAGDVLQPWCSFELTELPYFGFARGTLDGRDALISRTGYTGEYGFELYVALDDAAHVWTLMLDDARVHPAGLGARDTLRLEVGLPLYGHELSTARTPATTHFGFAMDLAKDFIGAAAVRSDTDSGPSEMLVGLTLEGRRSARERNAVVLSDTRIGTVTSGAFAPSLGHAVALAYVDRAYAAPGTQVQIDTGRTLLEAQVSDLPFYRDGSARRTTR